MLMLTSKAPVEKEFSFTFLTKARVEKWILFFSLSDTNSYVVAQVVYLKTSENWTEAIFRKNVASLLCRITCITTWTHKKI